MNLNTSRLYQDEKSLQAAWFAYYKKHGDWDFKTIEEGMSANYSNSDLQILQEHQFLITHDLKLAIKKLNKKIYEDNKDNLDLSEEDFYQKIFEHVLYIYSKAISQNEVAINYALHQYIFAKGMKLGVVILERKIEVKKKNGRSGFLTYSLIGGDYNNLGKINLFRLVKEKKIKTSGLQTKDTEQYPDFAIYINGLPAYVIEFKTPSVSWIEAWNDYKNKPSYHIFWACFGIDGVKSFISATYKSSNEPRLWAKYGSLKNETNYGAKDIADELICNKNNLLFYAFTCLLPVEEHYASSNRTERFLEALSVQQYYTVYAASQRFEMLSMQKKSNSKVDILKEVVKHVQRSGKSNTIRGIITSLFTFHNGLYSKVYIQVPDTTIKDQFLNRTFGNYFVLNIGNAIEIESKEEYVQSINRKENGLYIMNMQKISEYALKYTNKNQDILIILDEVHTHQLGENFQIRLGNFPNASYISFTATPRIVGLDKKAVNMTNTVYANGKNTYLDEFTSVDAIENNVIIPIVYEKAHYSVKINDDGLKKIDTDIYGIIKGKLDNPPNKVWSDYNKKIEDKIYENRNIEINLEEIKLKKIEEIKNFVDRSKDALIRQLYREIKIESIPKKVNWIVNDIKQKRMSVYSDQMTKELFFKTKNFWVVDDIEMATEIICTIKKQYGSCIAQDIRFAVDYSFISTSERSTIGVHKKYFPELYQKSDNYGNNFNTGYALTSLEMLNDTKIGNGSILDEFSTQEEGSVDVLIIVGKYIMGYDNRNLVAVYCDTEFSEISRIYQLATRPATKRENKRCGYFVDLGLGDKNAVAYKNAIEFYENSTSNITTFVLDEKKIITLNNELKSKLEDIGKIINATYPNDFLNLNQLDICLEKLETDNVKNKSLFFIKLTEINGILKKLAIPTNYLEHKQALAILGIAIGNFFDLLKAKKESVIRFTKDDLKFEINSLFISLGFAGGVKDVLDYQIKYSKDLNLSQVSLEKAKINRNIVMLKTKLENEDKYLNASIYEKVKELIKNCEQTNSIDTRKQIIQEIENIKLSHIQKRKSLNSKFTSSYERVIYEMLMDWLGNIDLSKVWSEETYSKFIFSLSAEVKNHFNINANNINKIELRKKIEARYPVLWIDALKLNENFINNSNFAIFRDRVISINNKNKTNQDLSDFIDKMVESLILNFEEEKGDLYV